MALHGSSQPHGRKQKSRVTVFVDAVCNSTTPIMLWIRSTCELTESVFRENAETPARESGSEAGVLCGATGYRHILDRGLPIPCFGRSTRVTCRLPSADCLSIVEDMMKTVACQIPTLPATRSEDTSNSKVLVLGVMTTMTAFDGGLSPRNTLWERSSTRPTGHLFNKIYLSPAVLQNFFLGGGLVKRAAIASAPVGITQILVSFHGENGTTSRARRCCPRGDCHFLLLQVGCRFGHSEEPDLFRQAQRQSSPRHNG